MNTKTDDFEYDGIYEHELIFEKPENIATRINGFDIDKERLPSEEFYTRRKDNAPKHFAQNEEAGRIEED